MLTNTIVTKMDTDTRVHMSSIWILLLQSSYTGKFRKPNSNPTLARLSPAHLTSPCPARAHTPVSSSGLDFDSRVIFPVLQWVETRSIGWPIKNNPFSISEIARSLFFLIWTIVLFRRLMANNITSDEQLVNTSPSHLCENKLIEYRITIPIHKHEIIVKFDHPENSHQVDLCNSMAFHARLSRTEVLLQRAEMVEWLKDHFLSVSS